MQIDSVSPIFPADDLAGSIAFYRDRLGFDLAWSWGAPPELASVCRDGIEIMLRQRSGDGPANAQVYLGVTGIDAWYGRLEAAGVTIPVPIGDRAYGMRDFRIVDPAGNALSFGQPVADRPTPSDPPQGDAA